MHDIGRKHGIQRSLSISASAHALLPGENLHISFMNITSYFLQERSTSRYLHFEPIVAEAGIVRGVRPGI